MSNNVNPIEKTVKEMEAQFKEWQFFLNNGIGILAFTLALGCLGTHAPSLNALLSFIFLSAIYCLGRKNFSQLYKELRNKKSKTTVEKVFYAGATKHFLGYQKILASYTVFFIGYLFLAFVMFGNLLNKYFPALGGYFYGG